MSVLSRRSAFGAVLSPAGIHVVEFQRGLQELRVVRYVRTESLPGDAAGSARSLGALLASLGARGRGVSLAVSGFGSCHQLLSLPAAPPEILRPVVAREMRRFHPDLFTPDADEPILEYVEIAAPAASAGSGNPARELLVAGAPAALVAAVTGALADYEIRVDGWTIAPRALQRLHAVFGDPEMGEAVVMMLPGAMLLGLFQGGAMRLFSEPAGAATSRPSAGRTAGEQVDRAALFLRSSRGLEVDEFGDQEPGALLALGAALDAERPDRLSLLPVASRPLSRPEKASRALAVAAVLVLAIASGSWSWDAHRAERAARARIESVQSRLAAAEAATTGLRDAVAARREHAVRARLLEVLARRHNRLPEVLWPLQAAAPDVEVVRLQVRPSDAGWEVGVTAVAHGRSGADATDAVDALVRQLEAQLTGGRVVLGEMAYAPLAAAGGEPVSGAEVTFELSFTVPEQVEPQG